MADRITFAAEFDPDLLDAARALAEREGRDVGSVIEEALANLLKARGTGKGRPHVMAAYEESLKTFGPLYERLAR